MELKDGYFSPNVPTPTDRLVCGRLTCFSKFFQEHQRPIDARRKTVQFQVRKLPAVVVCLLFGLQDIILATDGLLTTMS